MASKSHQDADPNAIIANEGDFIFKPKAFNIVWGNDSRYWRIPRSPIPEYELEQIFFIYLFITLAFLEK
ncbi:hypothetical protein PVK06_021030 [Gossypium arboreum]|uniref:Uncharacterized protein n=1 Tax=Gossypium arboreum TaxID=29729 RepID=A0ABR0PPD7_GOSAR|nr:hypothetical protein PVK06_021030 [Gossypium arboreum]